MKKRCSKSELVLFRFLKEFKVQSFLLSTFDIQLLTENGEAVFQFRQAFGL